MYRNYSKLFFHSKKPFDVSPKKLFLQKQYQEAPYLDPNEALLHLNKEKKLQLFKQERYITWIIILQWKSLQSSDLFF